jgi:hypothetical protein
MTISEAKEIIRRYQVARQGFQDFAVTQQEFDAALDLIASGVFLSDDKKDHPDAQLIYCEQSFTHTIEANYDKLQIENMLKKQIAFIMAEMLLHNHNIKFSIKNAENHHPYSNKTDTIISGKLIVISPPNSPKK